MPKYCPESFIHGRAMVAAGTVLADDNPIVEAVPHMFIEADATALTGTTTTTRRVRQPRQKTPKPADAPEVAPNEPPTTE